MQTEPIEVIAMILLVFTGVMAYLLRRTKAEYMRQVELGARLADMRARGERRTKSC